jgi:hypothetical protein
VGWGGGGSLRYIFLRLQELHRPSWFILEENDRFVHHGKREQNSADKRPMRRRGSMTPVPNGIEIPQVKVWVEVSCSTQFTY